MAAGEVVTDRSVRARVETGVLVPVYPSCGPVGADEILSSRQTHSLDGILGDAEHATGLRFAAYIGDLGADTRAGAEALLDSLGDDAPYAALVAISPGQNTAEIVTGAQAALRISERGTRAAVLSVVASCSDGDLYGGLTNGIRILTDHAGQAHQSDW